MEKVRNLSEEAHAPIRTRESRRPPPPSLSVQAPDAITRAYRYPARCTYRVYWSIGDRRRGMTQLGTTIPRRRARRVRMSYEQFLKWDGENRHVEWVNGEVI